MKKQIGMPQAIALVVGVVLVLIVGGYMLYFREKVVPYDEQQAKMKALFDKEAPKYYQKYGQNPGTEVAPAANATPPAGKNDSPLPWKNQ